MANVTLMDARLERVGPFDTYVMRFPTGTFEGTRDSVVYRISRIPGVRYQNLEASTLRVVLEEGTAWGSVRPKLESVLGEVLERSVEIRG